ncbi:MAG: ATP-binding protein [Bacteroidia bacterium]|nr:ATP-binding protein [Bacteroidia bacterium]
MPRTIEKEALLLSKNYSVLTITGPRQSGKTTLARHLFKELPYFSFENPDVRKFAINDPRKFFEQLPKGAILDEVQHIPEMLSYLQQIADDKEHEVLFVLTGSNHFSVMEKITQSLAGRTGILKLLPFSIAETATAGLSTTDEMIYKGFYPKVHTRDISPTKIYRNYYETYLQKDVRQLIQIKDLNLFDKFVRICAGRIGSLLNTSALANETGVSDPTIKSWLSVLEASYIGFLLPPFYENISKRMVKSPKFYFYDVGLASYLLGITDPVMVSRDPLRGSLFENLVIIEMVKHQFNSGLDQPLFFYRDNHSNEVDLIIKKADRIQAIEIKSSQTFHPGFLKGLNHLNKLFPGRITSERLVYDGIMEQTGARSILNFRTFSRLLHESITELT